MEKIGINVENSNKRLLSTVSTIASHMLDENLNETKYIIILNSPKPSPEIHKLLLVELGVCEEELEDMSSVELYSTFCKALRENRTVMAVYSACSHAGQEPWSGKIEKPLLAEKLNIEKEQYGSIAVCVMERQDFTANDRHAENNYDLGMNQFNNKLDSSLKKIFDERVSLLLTSSNLKG